MLCNKCYTFKASKEGVLFRDGAYWCEEHYDTAFLKEERERNLTWEKNREARQTLSNIANGIVTDRDKEVIKKYKLEAKDPYNGTGLGLDFGV